MGSKRLILIGGSAGAGKTTTAKSLAHELKAGWLQLDTIWLALQDAAPPGSEAHNILRIDEHIRESNAVEELVDHQLAASELVCLALHRVFQFELQAHETVVADGAWLLPRFKKDLVIENTTISAAILREPDREEVEIAMSSRREMKMVAPWRELSASVS